MLHINARFNETSPTNIGYFVGTFPVTDRVGSDGVNHSANDSNGRGSCSAALATELSRDRINLGLPGSTLYLRNPTLETLLWRSTCLSSVFFVAIFSSLDALIPKRSASSPIAFLRGVPSATA